MSVAVLSLCQASPYRIVGGVSFDDDLLLRVEHGQYRYRCTCFLESLECSFLVLAPIELDKRLTTRAMAAAR